MSEANKITIILLKPEITEFRDALRHHPPRVTFHRIEADQGIEGEVYSYKSPDDKQPPWMSFINEAVENPVAANVKHTSAVVLLRVNNRLFAVPFGSGGRFLVNESAVVRDFGMIVAMNTVNPDRVGATDSTTHEQNTQLIRRQTSRRTSLHEFRVNDAKQVLRAVNGESEDPNFANRVKASEGVIINFDKEHRIEFHELAEKCQQAFEAYNSNRYADAGRFPFYDNLKPEKTQTIIDALDAELVRLLKLKAIDNLHLAIPEVTDDSDIHCFTFGFRAEEPSYELSIDRYLELMEERDTLEELDLRDLKSRRILVTDGDGVELPKWNVYKCLVAEVQWNEQTYVLSMGEWRSVSRTFAASVRASIAHLDDSANDITLPVYDWTYVTTDENKVSPERNYNQTVVAQNPTFAMLDGTRAGAEGTSKVNEPCDLLTPQGNFIHVKRYKDGASSLSHVFAQASLATGAFVSDQKFREDIREELTRQGKVHLNPLIPDDKVDQRGNYRVVIGIIDDAKTSVLELPFMTQFSLKNALDEIQAEMGITLAVKFIN